MFQKAGKQGHFGGSAFVLIALGAACSGTVEQRYENTPDASGGTKASGGRGAGGGDGGTSTGGAVGHSGGGVGGTQGVGGTFGIAGTFGCFVAGTQIATPSGTRAIEELRLGDVVLAYDEHAGRVVPRPVTATFVHPDHPVGALPLSDGRVLRVTSNHPIYLPDQQLYADAGELTGDERLLTLTASTQTSSLIAGAFQASATEAATVYNITVAGEHNYFAEGVLVHNKSIAAGTGAGGGTGGGPSEGGACVPATLSGACYAFACLDPVWPTSEYVTLNQAAGSGGGSADAGPVDSGAADAAPPADAGPVDAAPVSRESGAIPDSGLTPSANLGWPVCNGRGVPNPAYLAFDVWAGPSGPPVVGISSGAVCSGAEIGEVWFQNDRPPPPNTETTQCIRLPQPVTGNLTLWAINGNTHVRNARFVSGCECARRLTVNTSCGYLGGPSGVCE
jgi:hypothetical protein